VCLDACCLLMKENLWKKPPEAFRGNSQSQ